MAKGRESSKSRGSNRLALFGGVGLLALIVIGVAFWFLFIRSSAPAAVDSTAAAEARQEAIDEAAAAQVEAEPEPAAEPAEPEPAADQGDTEVDVGQPDSAASVGAESDGVWTIDTSIGTFDDSCLSEVCSSTFVGFRIDEELVGIGDKTVVGRTPGVSGSMELLGSEVIGATFNVDMTGLITDSRGRTEALQGRAGGLETSTFTEAIFELTQPIDLGSIPVEGAAVEVQATGNLTVHGVTQPVTIPLTAELQAGLVVVFGQLEGMLLSDYDIPKPSAAAVLSVEDNAILELQLFLSR